MKLVSLCRTNYKKYILELVLLVILIFTLFVPSVYVRLVLSVFLLIYTFIATKLQNSNQKINVTNNKKILFIMFIFAIIYVLGYYILGLYFEYYTNNIQFGLSTIKSYILPLSIIIILSETLRKLFISREDFISNILITISMVILELALYSQIYDISRLNDFLTVLGFITFAAISCNLLYNYICLRYGVKPIIIYRLITVLYIYIIPILPDVATFFRATLRIIYPYFIYIVLESLFGKEKNVISRMSKRAKIINAIVVISIGILLTMLISCRFYIGILAIGSGSMAGTFDKGDAVVFTQYRGQDIYAGNIILFKKEQKIIVHRVIEIEKINNQKIYYTKGDKNNKRDEGFITDSDIIGIYKFGIRYIGYPSLWLTDIFKN